MINTKEAKIHESLLHEIKVELDKLQVVIEQSIPNKQNAEWLFCVIDDFIPMLKTHQEANAYLLGVMQALAAVYPDRLDKLEDAYKDFLINVHYINRKYSSVDKRKI